MDIPPDEARAFTGVRPTKIDFTDEQITQIRSDKENRAAGGPVKVYVSPQWTLEYDLCNHHLGIALLFFQAVRLAEVSKNRLEGISDEEMQHIKNDAVNQYHRWRIDQLSSNK